MYIFKYICISFTDIWGIFGKSFISHICDPTFANRKYFFLFHVRKREGFEGAAAPFDALGSQALRLGMWEILMGGSVVPKQLSLSNLNIAEKVSKLKLFFSSTSHVQ